jgi:SPP1 gp7 family putative phage head morphogenesis protein
MSVGARQASARIAAKSAVKIRAALAGSIDARRVYTQYMDTQPPITANKAQDRARARAWAMNNVKLDLEAYKKALRTHYAAMYVLGQREALENMATAAKAQKGPVATVNSKPKTNAQGMPIFDPNFSINWDAWTPGNETAAALLDEPGGLKKLLGDIDIQARGIADYSHDLLGTALADGIARGDTPVTIANDIRDSLSAPERALTIAITEGQRAKISANLDSYQANNVEQIEWTVNDPDDADCLDNEGEIVNMGDQFPSGDTQPPVHPNCQCDVIPVMPDLSGTPEYTDNTDNTDDSEMAVQPDLAKYSPDQERDERGRFGSGSGGGFSSGKDYSSDPQKFYDDNIKDQAFSNEQFIGMNVYQNSSDAINAALRADGPINPEIQSYVDRVNSAINQAVPLAQDTTLYRGITGDISSIQPGETLTDKAFMSTTADGKFATGWANKNADGYVVKISASVGTQGVIPSFVTADFKEEHEFLLPTNSQLQVISIDLATKTVEARLING